MLISAVLIGGAFTAAVAQDLFIYPAEGQNAEQQRRDRLECQLWATDQTGFDPTAPAQAGPQSQAQAPQVPLQGPGVPRSTARGAVIGTAGGAIAGNTGRGALVGATTGALMGAGRRAEQQASADWARQQQAAEAERQLLLQYRRQGFNRAVTACMEGRGYTVS
ncbi:MAG: glycine zipper family protein [Cyanobacteria bacterium J06638_7]